MNTYPTHTLTWRDGDIMVSGLNEHGEEYDIICRSERRAAEIVKDFRTFYRFKAIRVRKAERNNGWTHWSKVTL